MVGLIVGQSNGGMKMECQMEEVWKKQLRVN